MILTIAAGVLLAACGTSDDRAQSEEVVTRFYAAIEENRGGAACARLSTPARQELESQAGKPCRAAILELDLKAGAVTAATVFVTNARVDVAGGESAFLSRESEGWKLSALGCKPEDGKPRDRPFDCELQA